MDNLSRLLAFYQTVCPRIPSPYANVSREIGDLRSEKFVFRVEVKIGEFTIANGIGSTADEAAESIFDDLKKRGVAVPEKA